MRIYTGISLMLAFFCSCNDNNSDRQNPVITVSILPQKYFVEKIAGSKYDINVMIPPGASPATYDPEPNLLKQLNRSMAYFRIGHIGFEKNWMKKLQYVNRTMKVFDLSSGIDYITGEEHHEEKGQDRHNIDPHIWLSPRKTKTIVYNIYDALKRLDPADSLIYRNNYLDFTEDIDSIDSLIIKSFKDISNKKFFIYHPALTYFAEDYNLVQISIENEGKSPSPFHMKQLINLAQEENIGTILIQEQFDVENAQILAKEIQGSIIKINPLDENWEKQILYIAYQLKEALEKDTNK